MKRAGKAGVRVRMPRVVETSAAGQAATLEEVEAVISAEEAAETLVVAVEVEETLVAEAVEAAVAISKLISKRLCWRMRELLECTLIQGDPLRSPCCIALFVSFANKVVKAVVECTNCIQPLLIYFVESNSSSHCSESERGIWSLRR